MNDYRLEHICSHTGTLDPRPEIIGLVPEGFRVNFYATGGEVVGPRIRGKLRPVGGDWATVGKDNIARLDVRTTFETHDGAVILVTYQGVADLGEDGYDRFLRGEMPPVVRLQTAPRFAASHPGYVWLNRVFCLGVGEYHAAENAAKYDIYAVR